MKYTAHGIGVLSAYSGAADAGTTAILPCVMQHASTVTPVSKQMTIVIGLSVVGLMAFGLAISYYRNILFDRQLVMMQERNRKLKDDILSDYALLEYYKSFQYRDKYAKENFGLLRTGESVITIHSEAPENDKLLPSGELDPVALQALYEERLSNIRVIDHWGMFLFHQSAIDDLRRVQ
jgi:cell division protein FtsB